LGLVAAAIAAGVIMTQNTNFVKNTFADGGYILGEPVEIDDGGYASTQMPFVADTPYKTDSDANLVFNEQVDNGEEKAVVQDYGFMHYENGGLSSFKNGVVLDPETITGDNVVCYNVNEGSVIEHAGNAFSVEHLGENLAFDGIAWKLGGERYLFAGESVALALGDSAPEDFGDYAEVTYIDDGVIRVVSDENTVYTVSPDSELVLNGDIVINLGEKVIENGGTSFPMDSMVVDSADNVDIIEAPNAQVGVKIPKFTVIDGEDGAEGAAGAEGVAGNRGSAGSAGSAGESGGAGDPGAAGGGGNEGTEGGEGAEGNAGSSGPAGAGTGGSEGEGGGGGSSEQVDLPSLPTFSLPTFSVPEFDVDVLSGMKASIVVSEADLATTGITNLRAIITRTDKEEIVWTQDIQQDENWDGKTNYNFELNPTTGIIKPGVEYRLVVTGEYEVDSQTYTKNFVKKLFVGGDIGITVSKDIVSPTAIKLNIEREKYSDVNKITVTVYDELGGIAGQTTETLDPGPSSKSIMFSGLNANKTYSVVLTDLIDEKQGITIASTYSDPIEIKTLIDVSTITPGAIGIPNVSANRYNRTVSVSPSQDKGLDVNNIRRYTYEFYPSSLFTTSGALNPGVSLAAITPSLSLTTTDRLTQYANVNLTASFDPSTSQPFLVKNQFYRVRLKVEYNDNVKDWVLYSGFSEPAGLTGADWPSVQFEPNKNASGSAIESYYDKIIGRLVIESNGVTFLDQSGNPGNPSITVEFVNLDPAVNHRFTEPFLMNAPTNNNPANARYEIPVKALGLQEDATYSMAVWAYVDFNDGSPPLNTNIANVTIGKETAMTAMASGFTVGLEAGGTGGFINAMLWLTDPGTVEGESDYEASRLGEIELELYGGNSVESKSLGTVKLTSSVAAINGGSSLKDRLYNPYDPAATTSSGFTNKVHITEQTFSLSQDSVKGYPVLTLAVKSARDYTAGLPSSNIFVNTFDLSGKTDIQLKGTAVAPPPPTSSNAIDVILINEGNRPTYLPGTSLGSKRPGYEAGTNLGFRMTARFDMPSIAESVTYNLYRMENYVNDPAPATIPDAELAPTNRTTKAAVTLPVKDGVLPTLIVLFGPQSHYGVTDDPDDNIHYVYIENSEPEGRGYHYYATYTSKLTIENPYTMGEYIYPRDYTLDGGATFPYENGMLRSQRISAPHQTPKFTVYPSTSDDTSETWKYRFVDIDDAFGAGSLTAVSDGASPTVDPQTPLKSSLVPPIDWALYNEMKIESIAQNKAFGVAYKYKMWKYSDPLATKDANLMQWHHEPTYNIAPNDSTTEWELVANEESTKLYFVFRSMPDATRTRVATARITAASSIPLKSVTYDVPIERALPYTAGAGLVGVPFNAAAVSYQDINEDFPTSNTMLTLSVELIYDDGHRGMDVTSNLTPVPGYAIKTYSTDDAGRYYTRVPAGSVQLQDNASRIYYVDQAHTLPATEFGSGSLSYDMAMEDNRHLSVTLNYDNRGAQDMAGGGHIALKSLSSATAAKASSSTDIFYTPKLPPTVENYSATAGFTDATVNFRVRGANVLDGFPGAASMWLYLYEVEIVSGTTAPKLIDTIVIPMNASDADYTTSFGAVTALKPNTNYHFTLFGDMQGQHVPFYDATTQRVAREYGFKTAQSLQIGGATNNFTMAYRANAYNDKYLEIAYTLAGPPRGFYIWYEVVRTSDSVTKKFRELTTVFYTNGATANLGKIQIASQADAGVDMDGNGLTGFWQYGAEYSVKIHASSSDTGLGETNARVYTMPIPRQPQFIVTATPDTAAATGAYNTYPVVFKISPSDLDATITYSQYKVRILNSAPTPADITPPDIATATYTFDRATNRMQAISVPNLQVANGYTMQIYAVDDRNYVGPPTYPTIGAIITGPGADLGTPPIPSYLVRSVQFDVPEANALQIGDITVNPIEGATQLIFENEQNLGAQAKFIQYSIMKSDGSEMTLSEVLPFTIQTAGSGSDAYEYYNLPTSVSGTGVYLIELRFLGPAPDRGLVGQRTVSFRKLT
jgi:hypothetical protein